jgi:tetratricopeptide (TPR) repeat protein
MSKQAMEYKNKGNEEFRKGNHAKAIEFYTYATEMDPKNHIFFGNRATAYIKMQRFDKGLRDSRKAIKLCPKWEKGYWKEGQALMGLKEYEAAMKSFKTASDMQPENGTFKNCYLQAKKKVYADLSEAQLIKREANDMFKNGRMEEAIKVYTKALKVCKADEKLEKANIYSNRAACYRNLYDSDNVVKDCTNAIKLNPKHVKSYVRRAQSYESLEKMKEALADFEMACRYEPNMAVAYKGASRVRQAIRKREKEMKS